jgi:AcrR family transcriptional regulator
MDPACIRHRISPGSSPLASAGNLPKGLQFVKLEPGLYSGIVVRTRPEPTETRRRAPRGSLSAEQIIDAACELASRNGLQEMSMPQVARRLGVGVTSVYWYFRSRDELLCALADRVTAEFYAGLDEDAASAGDDRVLHYFRTFWSRLRENSLWREVFISSFRRTVGNSLDASIRAAQIHQRQIRRMTDAGLSVDDATSAHTILSAYTRGYVLVEHLRRQDDASAPFAPGLEDVPGLETYALVRQAVAAAAPEATFEIGLQALWHGLSRPK